MLMEARSDELKIRTGLPELLSKLRVSNRTRLYLYEKFMGRLSHSRDLRPMANYVALELVENGRRRPKR